MLAAFMVALMIDWISDVDLYADQALCNLLLFLSVLFVVLGFLVTSISDG